MANNYYPIMLDLTNKNCIIVGGGKVALRKVKGLINKNANIKVISPNIISGFYSIDNINIKILNKEYSRGDLKGGDVVFICTDSKEVNDKCLIEAKEENLLINMADRQSECDFILPSKIERGELTISISTSGNSPTYASKLKDDIEEMLPNGIEEYIVALGETRKLIKSNISDIKLRKKILNELVNEKILDQVRLGYVANINDLMMNIYSRYK